MELECPESQVDQLHAKVREKVGQIKRLRQHYEQLSQDMAKACHAEDAPAVSPAYREVNERLDKLLAELPGIEDRTGELAQERRKALEDAGNLRREKRKQDIADAKSKLLQLQKEVAQRKMASAQDALRPASPRGRSLGNSQPPPLPFERRGVPEVDREGCENSGSSAETPLAPPKASAKAKSFPAGPPPPAGTRSAGQSPRGSLPKGPPPPPKAKAKGPAPPLCKAKAKARTRFSTASSERDPADGEEDVDEDADASTMSARLVQVHWRPSQGPLKAGDMFVDNDGYLEGVREIMQRMGDQNRADRMRQSMVDFESRLPMASEARAATEQPQPDPAAGPEGSGRRRRRHTVFSPGEVPVLELPHHQLEEFFQAREATFDIGARASCASTVSTLIVDATHKQLLEIMVRSEVILRQGGFSNLSPGEAVEQAVAQLLHAVEQCDYTRLRPEMLLDLRKVAASHLERDQNILSFVESRGGIDALSKLEHPHLHRLLYGLIRIPAVPARLEYMAFVARSREDIGHCRDNLRVLRRALENVSNRLSGFARFWSITLKLGNTLNAGSSAPTAEQGFKLSTLPKLLELKSPLRKELTLLHFVLLWMTPAEIEELCNVELLLSLKDAQSKRAYTVHSELMTQLEGFRDLSMLVNTGRYKEQSVARRTAADPAEEPDESFCSSMRSFVEESRHDFVDLYHLGNQVFEGYKRVGLCFGDLSYVYPPPKEDQDKKRDLFDVLCKFIASVHKAHDEILALGLARDVGLHAQLQLPFMGGEFSLALQARDAEEHPGAFVESNAAATVSDTSQQPAATSKLVPATSCQQPAVSDASQQPAVACAQRPAASNQPATSCQHPAVSDADLLCAIDMESRPASIDLQPPRSAAKSEDVVETMLQEEHAQSETVDSASPACDIQVSVSCTPKGSPARQPLSDTIAASPDREGPLISRGALQILGQLQLPKSPLKSPLLRTPNRRDVGVNFQESEVSSAIQPDATAETAKCSTEADLKKEDPQHNPLKDLLGSLPAISADFGQETFSGQAPTTPHLAVEPISPSTPDTPATPTVPPPSRGIAQHMQYRLQHWAQGAPASLGMPGQPAVSPGALSSISSRTSTPEYTRSRKSLTRQADRAVADVLGSSASRIRGADMESIASWRITESSTSSPPRSLSPSSGESRDSSFGADSRNQDLRTQIRTEFRRRKSRGAPLNQTLESLQAFPLMAERADGFDSPRPTGSRVYPLTPVMERGETPFRSAPRLTCQAVSELPGLPLRQRLTSNDLASASR
eukprot:TRINITY_DN20372_c0_g1_i2.p1 TRINITY_DN20372_c0_g1~~TRINITY_DN20372_c0_g1_i2.p1  ORF type:complete len:1273 (-),score=203.61 TRINITY_DN20372_c0_g1_i2:13-3831(-)